MSNSRRVRVVRAGYDAAFTTGDGRRHWADADGLSANTANSPEVRRTLSDRARHEIANNAYARGIVLTLANEYVGIGQRLQLRPSGRGDVRGVGGRRRPRRDSANDTHA
jgi:hypothetical protein